MTYDFSRILEFFTDISSHCFLLFPHIGEVKQIHVKGF